MEQRQEQPIHWDRNRSSFNLTLIFAAVVAVIGIAGNPPLLIIGLGVAAYSWLTTPKQFLIYRDALVIIYGRPRNKIIPFAEISHLETLTLPMGDRLRLRMANGRRVMLMPKDTETFRVRLDEALAVYHGEQRTQDHGGHGVVEGTVLNETPGEPSTQPDSQHHASNETQSDSSGNESPPFDNDASSEEEPRTPY